MQADWHAYMIHFWPMKYLVKGRGYPRVVALPAKDDNEGWGTKDDADFPGLV